MVRPDNPRIPLHWFVQIVGESEKEYTVLIKKNVPKGIVIDYEQHVKDLKASAKEYEILKKCKVKEEKENIEELRKHKENVAYINEAYEYITK